MNVSFEGESIDIDAYSVTSVVLNTEVLAIKFTKLPLSTSASAVENQIVELGIHPKRGYCLSG